MTPLALLALTGCLAVAPASGRIRAGDFADAWPAMASLPPEAEIALAPAPGMERVFGVAELRQIAIRFHLSTVPEAGLCFERKTAVLDPAVLRSAMQRTLPGAQIEVLDFSRAQAPEGVLEFPRSGLRSAPGGAFWSGFVRYAGSQRFFVWARVNVRASSKRVVAREPLKAGTEMSPALLIEQTREEFPTDGFAETIEAVVGMVLRRPVSAGEAIQTSWLEPPKLVLRGEKVCVEVQHGAARLALEGRAESSGAAGQMIPVLNPMTHRTFRARVAGKGRVLVDAGKS